jgi:hypothetical protein
LQITRRQALQQRERFQDVIAIRDLVYAIRSRV